MKLSNGWLFLGLWVSAPMPSLAAVPPPKLKNARINSFSTKRTLPRLNLFSQSASARKRLLQQVPNADDTPVAVIAGAGAGALAGVGAATAGVLARKRRKDRAPKTPTAPPDLEDIESEIVPWEDGVYA